MCISIGPTSFSKTIHGAFEVRLGGQDRHAVFYQNTVGAPPQRQARRIEPPAKFTEQGPRRRPAWAQQGTPSNWAGPASSNDPRGNALVIPLLGERESIQLIDLRNNRSCLKNIAEAVKPRSRGDLKSFSFSMNVSKGVEVIEYDVYTVLLADHPTFIPEAVAQLPANKRPPLNAALFEALGRYYDSPIAVCCFDPEKAGEAAPVGFHYVPFDPEHLFLYTLDGHDGELPNLNAPVKLDHTLFVGSCNRVQRSGAYVSVGYDESRSGAMGSLLLDSVMGTEVNREYLNGDVVFDLKEVRQGIFRGRRVLPPGAPADPSRKQEVIELR
ncbi:MAG: hypothetical protein K2W82_16630 [Candidatus Obscuribacterales bacterium]|nr:hypothetical protein [Candidatus Obscuribacterales bacterium]